MTRTANEGPATEADAAEDATLAAMLRDNVCIGEVLQIISAGDFRRDVPKRLFERAVEVWQRGKPVDVVILAAGLDIDDIRELGRIAEVSASPANVTHYAEIVREHSLLRSLRQVGAEISHDAEHPPAPAAELLEKAEKRIFELSQLGECGEALSMADVLKIAFDGIDERARDKSAAGISTGWRELDNITGGIRPGEFVVVAARPSVGKTAFAAGMALAMAKDGAKVMFVSLEQSKQEIGERFLILDAEVSSYRVRQAAALTPMEVDQLQAAASRLNRCKLWVDDRSVQTVTRICGQARRFKARRGLDVVFIDYLQLIDPEPGAAKANRQEQVSGMSRRLKILARELKVPVICLAQLNRQPEGRDLGKPRLGDLRESGAIEQDADGVYLLSRPEQQLVPGGTDFAAWEGKALLQIAKQRNGPTGEITLRFIKHCMKFADAEVIQRDLIPA